MSKSEVMNVFKMLARSQGLYGRILRDIYEVESAGEDLTNFFNRFKNCKTSLDVVMEIEA